MSYYRQCCNFACKCCVNMIIIFQIMGSLEEVHMPQNGINHPGVTALAKALQHNTCLRILNLNDNTFTEKGAIAMAKVQRQQSLVSMFCFFFQLQKNNASNNSPRIYLSLLNSVLKYFQNSINICIHLNQHHA